MPKFSIKKIVWTSKISFRPVRALFVRFYLDIVWDESSQDMGIANICQKVLYLHFMNSVKET